MRHPQTVVPLIAVQAADDGRRIGSLTGLEAHRIHLVDTTTGPMMDQILISLTLAGIGRPCLPNAIGDLVHVQIFTVPIVEITYDTDCSGIGCPNAKYETINTVPGFRMASQQLISLGAVAGVVVI
jgi:hypothetical protein